MTIVVEAAATPGIVGRTAELATLKGFLDAGAAGRALILSGGPGIGKTTLWNAGVAAARERGVRVLVARPSEAEAQLSLAALADLLANVADDVLDALPAPQRRAVEVALLRRDSKAPLDSRAVAAGALGVVRELARGEAVLVAVDDVQWLDSGSEDALAFLSRRLDGHAVSFLVSERVGSSSRLARALAREGAERLEVTGLSLGAIRHLLDEIGLRLPRWALRQLYDVTAGNPLFALEVGYVVSERGLSASSEPLPVPHDVQTLVRQRVSELAAPTRELLLAAALLARPTLEALGAALGSEVADELGEAERAGMVAVEGGVLAFAHPLHGAAVVANAGADRRREMHRRIAEVVSDSEERARHVALALEHPDERAAAILENGAAAARARGGLRAAAELLETARAYTPPENADTSRRRGVEAAELYLHVGDIARARVLLEELLSAPLARAQRAQALRILGEICLAEEDLAGAEKFLLQALAVAEDAPAQARIRQVLMYVVSFSFDFGRIADLGREALALLSRTGDAPLLAEALAGSAIADYLAGRDVDWRKVERALELEDPDRISLPGLPPTGIAGLLSMWVGRHREAGDLINLTCTRLADRGDERDLAHALLWRSWLELRCGQFAVAAATADDALTCAAITGNRIIARYANVQRAWVDAHRGDASGARRRCAEALGGEDAAIPQLQLWAAAAQAVLGCSMGDYKGVVKACRPFLEAVERHGIGEPVLLVFLPDALEALIAIGDVERADALLRPFEESAGRFDRPWALATAKRCRALVHAARGDLAAAEASFDEALAEHERIDLPFERARTLLALGSVQRRARRRALARDALDEAAGEFERMGAMLWAEQARGELERVGGRRRGGAGELTATEQRVVELAADGLTNKEIAQTLYVSVHTVEVHLSHAYAKLGVRSRTQLARRLATRT